MTLVSAIMQDLILSEPTAIAMAARTARTTGGATGGTAGGLASASSSSLGRSLLKERALACRNLPAMRDTYGRVVAYALR